jgi:hypothetical protein
MPTILRTFLDSEVKVRYKEPFLTEGINAKHTAIVPPGVHRGFRLTSSPITLRVLVDNDPITKDHVAVYQTADGYTLTIRKTGGAFNENLSALLNTTQVIAIYVEYGLNVTTVAEIRAYELSPTDEFTGATERDELIVLGTVDVPAVGIVIPEADIKPARRDSSWFNRTAESQAWHQVVRNGGFEIADVGTNLNTVDGIPPWSVSSPTFETTVQTTAPHSGEHELRVRGSGVSGVDTSIGQDGTFPLREGDYVRVSFWIRGSLTTGIAAGGVQGIRIVYYDEDLAFVGFDDVSDDTLGLSFSYTNIEEILKAPAGTAWMRFLLLVDDNGSGLNGDLFFDDVQVWIERQPVPEIQTVDTPREEQFLASQVNIAPGISAFSGLSQFLARTIKIHQTANSSPFVLAFQHLLGDLEWIMDLVGGSIRADRQILDLGNGIVSAAADAVLGRITSGIAASGVSRYTLLWDITVPGSNEKVRLYAASDPGAPGRFIGSGVSLVLVANAYWDATTAQWFYDDATTQYATRFDVRPAGVLGFIYSSLTSPWVEGAWSTTGIRVVEFFQLLGFGSTTLKGVLTMDNSGTSSPIGFLNDVEGNVLMFSAADFQFEYDELGSPQSQYSRLSTHRVFPEANDAHAWASLERIPNGATITEIRVWVDQNSSNTTPFIAALYYDEFDSGGGPGTINQIVGSSQSAPTTAGQHEILWTPSVTVVKNPPGSMRAYYIEVISPTPFDAADQLQGAMVIYEHDTVEV